MFLYNISHRQFNKFFYDTIYFPLFWNIVALVNTSVYKALNYISNDKKKDNIQDKNKLLLKYYKWDKHAS